MPGLRVSLFLPVTYFSTTPHPSAHPHLLRSRGVLHRKERVLNVSSGSPVPSGTDGTRVVGVSGRASSVRTGVRVRQDLCVRGSWWTSEMWPRTGPRRRRDSVGVFQGLFCCFVTLGYPGSRRKVSGTQVTTSEWLVVGRNYLVSSVRSGTHLVSPIFCRNVD